MKKLKKTFILLMLMLSFSAFALFGFGEYKNADIKEKTASECEIPAFARAIGHEDQWLLHNGCQPRKEANKDVPKNTKEEK